MLIEPGPSSSSVDVQTVSLRCEAATYVLRSLCPDSKHYPEAKAAAGY